MSGPRPLPPPREQCGLALVAWFVCGFIATALVLAAGALGVWLWRFKGAQQ